MRMYKNELGRSMIEMLGVLAIVGILSVGGIAGFQKAMRKHQITQAREETSMFINELLPHAGDFLKLSNKAGAPRKYDITPLLDFILPKNWKRQRDGIYDSLNNRFLVDVRRDWGCKNCILFSYQFKERGNKREICLAMFELANLYKDSLFEVLIWRNLSSSDQVIYVYGTAHCGKGGLCLDNITYSQMVEACDTYKDDDKDSSFALLFPI